MKSRIWKLLVIAAVTLGVAGALSFSSVALNGSGSDEPAIAAQAPPAPMVVEQTSRSETAEPLGSDVFGRIPEIVDRVQPAVVSVLVETRDGGAEGSGVIVDGRRGLVVTNDHVVEGATDVEVVLASGERVDARVRATDAVTDLALLAVERTGLPEARFADELPRVGELAIALGNPLGFENSVTAGIVSGLHRVIPSGGQAPSLVDLIQTDAPISPGKSGGALVDKEGEVIGINVAAIPPTPDTRAVSIGFAIPAPTAASVVKQLVETGRASHAQLGIQPANLTPDLAEQFGVEATEGALVVAVADGGSADRAGLREGDVIVAFNRQPIRIAEDLLAALRRYRPGDEVALTVLRAGERLTVSVALGARAGG